MADFCTVTGFIYTPNVAPVSSTSVTFVPSGWDGVSNGAVSPAPATATTSALGALSVALHPGQYRVTIARDVSGFVIEVPDAASAALKDILL